MASDTAPTAYGIELVDMNGTAITTFTCEELDWETVGSMVEAMENDMVARIPGARTDGNGIFMERFKLVYGNPPVVMAHAFYVTDYFICDWPQLIHGDPIDPPPPGPLRMTLVKVPVDEATRKRIATNKRMEGRKKSKKRRLISPRLTNGPKETHIC